MNVLVLEDTVEINKILTQLLEEEGYSVFSCLNAFDALKVYEQEDIQCILTDLMLPIMSGEQFIETIRKTYNGLIIAITAKTGIEDKLHVLELGADDYIFKPFHKQEVALKVKNYFAKLMKKNSITSLNKKEFVFDHNNNSLFINDNELILTSVEFITLGVLVDSLNQIVTRETILDHVYSTDKDVFDRVIDGYVKNIRKKIKKYSDTEFIKTVYGMGYKLVGDKDE